MDKKNIDRNIIYKYTCICIYDITVYPPEYLHIFKINI